jgi:DNA-binding NarL/FixJ family response regulator
VTAGVSNEVKGSLAASPTRILVVDDYEPWRRFASSKLQKQPGYQVAGEVSDGLEAIRKAQELQPDLIILDIGLPNLNGIEAARQIRRVTPASRILFMSENRSPEIVERALKTGAGGYVVKSDAARELVPAVKAVLQGERFVSASLASHAATAPKNDYAATTRHCHEVAFCANDDSVIDSYARFIESALKCGDAVIVVVTEAHRESLVSRLEADGMNLSAVIEQGSYFLLDAADALSKLTVNGMPDPVRCEKAIGDLIRKAAKGVKGECGRVAVCGEMSSILLSEGNAEGTIKLEHLWDEITRGYGVYTLCGYLSSAFPNKTESHIFEAICAEHSAVHGVGY